MQLAMEKQWHLRFQQDRVTFKDHVEESSSSEDGEAQNNTLNADIYKIEGTYEHSDNQNKQLSSLDDIEVQHPQRLVNLKKAKNKYFLTQPSFEKQDKAKKHPDKISLYNDKDEE